MKKQKRLHDVNQIQLDNKLIFTTAEVGDLGIHLSPSYQSKLRKEGKLGFSMIGKNYVYTADHIIDFIEKNEKIGDGSKSKIRGTMLLVLTRFKRAKMDLDDRGLPKNARNGNGNAEGDLLPFGDPPAENLLTREREVPDGHPAPDLARPVPEPELPLIDDPRALVHGVIDRLGEIEDRVKDLSRETARLDWPAVRQSCLDALDEVRFEMIRMQIELRGRLK